jgi:hypothetical protein
MLESDQRIRSEATKTEDVQEKQMKEKFKRQRSEIEEVGHGSPKLCLSSAGCSNDRARNPPTWAFVTVDLKLKYSCNGVTISICYEVGVSGADSGCEPLRGRWRPTDGENVRTTAIVVRMHRITQLLVIGGTSLSQASMAYEWV